MSQQTKKYKTLSAITGICSVVLLLGPLAYYFIIGFMVADATYKFVLSMSLVMCLFLTVVSIMAKLNLRCPIFILLLALYFALDTIVPMLILMACATILDELLFSPLHRYFKSKYSINKEIDKRMV